MCPNPCVRIHVRKNAHNVSNHVLLMLMMLLLMTLLLLMLLLQLLPLVMLMMLLLMTLPLLMLMMLLLMTLLLLLLMTLLFVGHPKTLCGACHSHRQSRPNLSLELPSHRWVHAETGCRRGAACRIGRCRRRRGAEGLMSWKPTAGRRRRGAEGRCRHRGAGGLMSWRPAAGRCRRRGVPGLIN
jgi:hypothetical protein